MTIDRWRGSATGRSRMTAFGPLLYLVANTDDSASDFPAQAKRTLELLDANLRDGRSNRSRLLTVQVLLQDIRDKPAFEALWQDWIGPNPEAWPQRSCYEVVLTPTLLIEIVAVAARDDPGSPPQAANGQQPGHEVAESLR